MTARSAMALRIVCMCGYVIQGDDGDELWPNAQDHMGLLHPELVLTAATSVTSASACLPRSDAALP
jgi:hypothetical protein